MIVPRGEWYTFGLECVTEALHTYSTLLSLFPCEPNFNSMSLFSCVPNFIVIIFMYTLLYCHYSHAYPTSIQCHCSLVYPTLLSLFSCIPKNFNSMSLFSCMPNFTVIIHYSHIGAINSVASTFFLMHNIPKCALSNANDAYID